MNVRDIEGVRVRYHLKEIERELQGLWPKFRHHLKTCHHTEIVEGEAIVKALERMCNEYRTEILTASMGRLGTNPEHADLPEVITETAKEVTNLYKAAAKRKDDPRMIVAAWELLQAAVGFVWALGAANSRDIWGLSKSVFSAKGWDWYHEAQLLAIEQERSHGK